MPVALMSLDDRVLHAPGDVHGRTRCEQWVRDPWMIGPYGALLEKADVLCERCYGNDLGG